MVSYKKQEVKTPSTGTPKMACFLEGHPIPVHRRGEERGTVPVRRRGPSSDLYKLSLPWLLRPKRFGDQPAVPVRKKGIDHGCGHGSGVCSCRLRHSTRDRAGGRELQGLGGQRQRYGVGD